MDKVTKDVEEVAVIVGRFQTPYLHEGHRYIIESVKANHPRLILLLGQTAIKSSKNNPLDFHTRKLMIEQEYPDIEIYRIDDVGDDALWSHNLDKLISSVTAPSQSVLLYGSRDSFIKHYKGKYKTEEIKAQHHVSASEVRNKTGIKSKNTLEFREGVVWAMQQQYPKVYPTVDVAIFDEKNKKLLLGKKPGESKWRFIGGFADVNSSSYEADAAREVEEETGLIVDPYDLIYLGSFRINDWRYFGECDKITTSFFVTTKFEGTVSPNDDIDKLIWLPYSVGPVVDKNINNWPDEVWPLNNMVKNHEVLKYRFQSWYENVYLGGNITGSSED